MENLVSKQRSRKARQRQKQAGRGQAPPVPFRDHRAIGYAVFFLAWVVMSVFMRFPLSSSVAVSSGMLYEVLGQAAFSLAGLFATVLMLDLLAPSLLVRNSRLILLALIVLLAAASGRCIQLLADPFGWLSPETVRFLLPFTMAPLLGAILLGGAAGLALGSYAALVMALYSGGGLPVLLAGMSAAAFIAATAREVRTRSKVIRLAVMAGMLQFLVVLGETALRGAGGPLPVVLNQSGALLAGALLAAVIVLLVLPLLEHLFAITTDISLLEFSDLGHPLLQRLAIEAPGTYHHSLVVANIAQAAAEAIGANSLEARVSAYFHDIGKLTKPNFFAENIHLQENPHDQLSPSMSTLIITSHVKEGLSLAMLYKLPEPVRRAIREHHGSSMLQCFHHKALNQLELDVGIPASQAVRIDDHSFRYPGPRPSTRVSGIVCLADAVEASSRSLEKPTPAHLENLVNDIVRKRLDDGQLDDCELSLLDLSKVRRAFVFTLTTMLHGRIAYPKDDASNS